MKKKMPNIREKAVRIMKPEDEMYIERFWEVAIVCGKEMIKGKYDDKCPDI